jgi:hypothetical protein
VRDHRRRPRGPRRDGVFAPPQGSKRSGQSAPAGLVSTPLSSRAAPRTTVTPMLPGLTIRAQVRQPPIHRGRPCLQVRESTCGPTIAGRERPSPRARPALSPGKEGRRIEMKLSHGLLVAAALGVGAIAASGCKASTNRGEDPVNGPDPAAQFPDDPSGPTARGDEPGPRRARRHHGRHGRGGGPGRSAWSQGPGDDGPNGPRGPWTRGGGDGPGDQPGARGPWGHGQGDGPGDDPGPRGRWRHGQGDGPGDDPGPRGRWRQGRGGDPDDEPSESRQGGPDDALPPMQL